MASFFNMKGTTQSSFMVGVKGPILTKAIYGSAGSEVTYLLLPTTLADSIVFRKNSTVNPSTNYINADTYTGNAATATKLSQPHIGLAISGIRVSHVKPNGATDSGLSDGSDKIFGELLGIDASKIELVQGSTGLSYSVLDGITVSGDLNSSDITNANQKIASASHTHSQYLQTGTSGFTITTKNGETTLGNIKINNASETATTTSDAPQTLKLELDLRDNAVGTAKIASGAVTSAKIDTGAVLRSKIADGAITPAKLEDLTSNGNGGYTNGDYSGKIAKVVSANHLNTGGTIAGVNISDILRINNNNTAYTSTVNNAWNSQYAYEVYDTTAGATDPSATAAEIISAVNKVAAASSTASNGKLVLWTSSGINGNAATATKLKDNSSFWGNSFTGEATTIGSSTTAANISYTGNITPQAGATFNVGASDKRYNYVYAKYLNAESSITGSSITAATGTINGTITVQALTIDSTNGTGINLSTKNITNVGTITATTYASNKSTIGAQGDDTSIKDLYVKTASNIHFKKGSSWVTLSGELDGKADSGHIHDITTLSCSTVGNDGYVVLGGNNGTTKIATPTHKHTMSDITDIAGVYQFKGTLNSVTIDNNGKIVVSSVPNPANGNVYNVLTEFEWQGELYPAGTNIVYEKDIPIENSEDLNGEWKPLGGVFDIDLADFVTSVEGGNILNHLGNAIYSSQGRDLTDGNLLNRALAVTIGYDYGKKKVAQGQSTLRSFTTYLPHATSSNFGLVRLFDSATASTMAANTSGRNYAVQMMSDNSSNGDYGRLYVYVPWDDKDTIDRYELITTKSIVKDTESESRVSLVTNSGKKDYTETFSASDPIYLKLIHDNASVKEVSKRIKIQGTNDAIVTYTNEAGSSGKFGILDINVPKRAGYSIPLIKCVSMPSIWVETSGDDDSRKVVTFSADPNTLSSNGVYNCDENKIKDGSLVLLYLEHVEKLYNTASESHIFTDRRARAQVYIPQAAFSYDGNAAHTFEIITPDIESEYMYFADFSKKLFLCQINISHGTNTLAAADNSIGQNTSTIKIIEDVGHEFSDLDAPRVYLKNKGFRLVKPNDTLLGMIRRYNGTAKVILRTLILGKHSSYIPITDLDVDLTNVFSLNSNTDQLNSIDLYNRNNLIDNVCYAYDVESKTKSPFMDSTSTGNILFKGDMVHLHYKKKARTGGVYLNKKKNIGIRKPNGNVTLSTLDIDHERHIFMRDYTKIKFQFVLQFNNSTVYDICGGVSGDEYTLTKSNTVKGGYWAINIDKNII